MKKLYLLFFIIFCSIHAVDAQLYIMKTNTGGCNNYSEHDAYYGGAIIDYAYAIRSKDGNWLCPIIETGEYLIFDQKPESYYFDVEEFGDYNVPFDYNETILIVNGISNCQKAEGSNYGVAANTVPYFEIMSNQVLTPPGVDNSFSDKIALKAVGCTGNQRFFWEYKIDGNAFQKTNVGTGFNEEFEFIKSNFIPADYYGSLDFRVTIDSDPSILEENIYSNIVSYKIIPAAPKIVNISTPNFTKCNYSNDGEVSLTFQRDLLEGEQYELFLKNIDDIAVDNKVITKFMMPSSRTYTWTGLSKQKYIVTYQTRLITGNSEYLSTPLNEVFNIESPEPLNFSMTEIQPLCQDDKGKIIINVSGGRPPYYYKLNSNPEIEFVSPRTVEVNLGDNYIKVIDSMNCIDETAKG